MKKLNGILEQYDKEAYRIFAAGLQEEFAAKINDVVEELLQYDSSQKEVYALIEKWSTWVQAYKTCMETKEEINSFYMGLLSGVITAAEQKAWEEKEEEYYTLTHADTKYYDMIFKELYPVDYMQHKVLAEKLSVTTSQLTNIMKRVANDEQHMIITSHQGKFKYYFLSELGKKYYNHRFGTEDKKETEELLEALIRRIKYNERRELLQYAEQTYPLQGKIRRQIYELDKELTNREKEKQKYYFYIEIMAKSEHRFNVNAINSNIYSKSEKENPPYRENVVPFMKSPDIFRTLAVGQENMIMG